AVCFEPISAAGDGGRAPDSIEYHGGGISCLWAKPGGSMTQQVINIGTNANDGTGDTERAAFGKVNANFAELYGETVTTKVAATYAAARAISGIATGDRLQVLGRTSQSDGGQGLFTWVAGGTTTVDE